MQTIVIETQYLPPISVLMAMVQTRKVKLESYENFQKQTWRNRCRILTSQGTLDLIVPLQRPTGRLPIREVEIDYSQNWVAAHLRTLESAYRKAPFYEHYADKLESFLMQKPEKLWDLNMGLLSLCLKWFKTPVEITETMSWEQQVKATETDYRSYYSPKKEVVAAFKPYQQVFGSEFVANLSCIDLIFNVGPGSFSILTEAGTN